MSNTKTLKQKQDELRSLVHVKHTQRSIDEMINSLAADIRNHGVGILWKDGTVMFSGDPVKIKEVDHTIKVSIPANYFRGDEKFNQDKRIVPLGYTSAQQGYSDGFCDGYRVRVMEERMGIDHESIQQDDGC